MTTRYLLTLSVLALAATAFADPLPPGHPHLPAPAADTHPATTAPVEPRSPKADNLTPSDKLAITHGQITLPTQTLHYTVTTGYLPLKDEKGNARANIFFMAYTKDPAAATTTTAPVETRNSKTETRPVTFLFNGGPGSASAWLHLGAVGPKRIAFTDSGELPAPPYKLVDNQSTWLADTDLVFIDPVGTGYSRAANPEQAKEFYGVREDANAMAEFIRLWTTRYQRWDSPKFLAGESYGTTRAAVLAELLQERQGIALNGIVLMSTVLNFATLQPGEGNDIGFPLYLPTYAAVAWYHKKLSLDTGKPRTLETYLAEVESYAATTYTVALMKGSTLPAAERAAVAAKLASYTGIPADTWEKADLRLTPGRFQKLLLADQQKVLGRFDGRITGAVNDQLETHPEFDPSLSYYYPAYTAAFNEYVRNTLHYENDLPYEVLSNKVGPWNWGSPWGGGGQGALYVGDDLANAMRRNPHLKVLVCSGRFDLATPYFATLYTFDHLSLSPALRKNITQTFYPAGHMMYHEKSSLEALHANVAALLRAATANQP